MLGHKLYQTLRESLCCAVTVRSRPESLKKFGFFVPDEVFGGVDATDFTSIEEIVTWLRPKVLVNCIGIVKQHPLSDDAQMSFLINSLLPHKLAALCAKTGCRLIHISTDCVFSGEKGFYSESDLPDANDLYGLSKALGETKAPNALTIRTSIIGRGLTSHNGLIDWFLRNRGNHIKGYTQAVFSGLTTIELSKVIERIVTQHPTLHGLYNVASEPIDKYSLLCIVREKYDLDTVIEEDDTVKINRSLNGALFHAATGYFAPSWPEMIAEMASDPTPYDVGVLQ